MSGEIYLAGKNFLVNTKWAVIEKRREPVGSIKIYVQWAGGGDGKIWVTGLWLVRRDRT